MNGKAKESSQIQKARNKIKQQLKKAEKKMSPEALNTMSRLIKEQLKRQQPVRISLKERQVTSFDENKHSAKTKSKFIIELIHQIRRGQSSPESDLEGRIRTIAETDS